jgi:hypothetical protein
MLERYRTMKNSLFKRAIAAAATVPFALAQIATSASAVSINDAALTITGNETVNASEKNTFTLDKGVESSLAYITPGIAKGDVEDQYIQVTDADGNVVAFEKYSDWNDKVVAALTKLASGDKATGVINLKNYESDIMAQVAKIKDGAYVSVAKNIFENLTREDITYSVSMNGDITIVGKVHQPAFYGNVNNSIGGALSEIANKYGASELAEVDFSAADVSGTYTIVIKGSSLRDGTNVAATFKFEANEGGSYSFGELPEFGITKVNQLKDIAKNAINSSVLTDDQKAAECAKIDDKMDKYIGYFEKINNQIDHVLSINKSVDYSNSGNISGALKGLNDYIAAQGYAKYAKIPTTATEAAAKTDIAKFYDKALSQVNNGLGESYSVEITANEIGALLDSLTELKVTDANGKGTATAKLEDKEAEAVRAYFAEAYPEYEVKEVYKLIDAKADISGINASAETSVSAGFELKRVVEVVTTTATTTDTVSTTTETVTTSTETETGTATTSSTESTSSTETTGTGTATTSSTESTSSTETGTATTSSTESTSSTETGTATTSSTESTSSTETGTGTATTSSTESTSSTETGTATTSSTESTSSTETGTATTSSTESTSSTETGTATTSSTESTSSTDTTSSTESTSSTDTTSTDTVTTSSTDTTSTDTDTTSSTDTTSTDTETTSSTDTTSTDTDTTSTDTTSTDTETTSTETTPVTTTTVSYSYNYVVNLDETPGFYLDIDTSFNLAQIKGLTLTYSKIASYYGENEDGELELISTETVESDVVIDITDKASFGNQTPGNTYTTEAGKFTYDLTIYAAEDILDNDGNVYCAAGEALPVTASAFIGVKGDADLNKEVSSADASAVLKYYAALSSGKTADDVQLSPSNLVNGSDDVLDQFAAFLADVDAEDSLNNWNRAKSDRDITSGDASFILKYYAKISAGSEHSRTTWNTVLGK